AGEADTFRDVFEFAVAEVAVELARVPLELAFVGAIEIAAAGDENVEPAIAVVVDERDAATDRFEDRELLGVLAVVEGEVQARRLGDVAEPNGHRRRSGVWRWDGRRRTKKVAAQPHHRDGQRGDQSGTEPEKLGRHSKPSLRPHSFLTLLEHRLFVSV